MQQSPSLQSHQTYQKTFLNHQPSLQSNKKSDNKSYSDRFIPDHINNYHLISNLTQNIYQQNELQYTLNNYHTILQQCVVGNGRYQRKQSIGVYQNRNLLHFRKQGKKNEGVGGIDLLGFAVRQSLLGFKPVKRKISRKSIKVLQAPALQDDFYLNLIDWSSYGLISVGLASSAYLWNPKTGVSFQLCDFGFRNYTTSVSFSKNNPILALGTHSGVVHIWDIQKSCRIRSFGGHTQRVGAMSWNTNVLSTGSKDCTILQRDIRSLEPYTAKLSSHNQQICGLKWSIDSEQLCSGGNDNKLIIWSNKSNKPLLIFDDHCAAVKALAWSPHQHGLLASGGGTADRTIKFRNTITGQSIKQWDTGSQVCNIAFSQSLNQLVSTHGYSQNQVAVWQYQSNKRIAKLTGHTYRVLFMAMSPDGSTAVTGSGDQTIRFWQIFPPQTSFLQKQSIGDTPLVIR